jgi:hypothetical protein
VSTEGAPVDQAGRRSAGEERRLGGEQPRANAEGRPADDLERLGVRVAKVRLGSPANP